MIQLLAVFLGGGLGAASRWGLSLWLNKTWPAIQYGTLTANLTGGFLIGLALAFLAFRGAYLAPEWRLFCITGFLGGLTTFSTFSSEVIQLFDRGHPGAALATIGLNLFGSLILTAFGLILGWLLFKV